MARTKATARKTKTKPLPKRALKSTPLPLEVCERIIDFVALALHPLRLYHIVCRFDKIQSAEDLSTYVAMLRKYPIFTRYAHDLHIAPDWDAGEPTWLSALPMRLGIQLRNVKCLTMSSRPSDPIHDFHPRFYLGLPLFLSVTELHYAFASQSSHKHLLRVASLLPNLQKLHVGGTVTWPDAPSAIDAVKMMRMYPAKHHLKHVVLGHGIESRVSASTADWLRAVNATATLENLELWGSPSVMSNHDRRSTLGGLVADSVKLESLTLCFNPTDLNFIDLQNNQTLRELEIMTDGAFADILASVVRLLSDITLPHLRDLTIRFNLLDDPDETTRQGLQLIDSLLSSARFCRLKQVSIDIDEDLGMTFPRLSSAMVKVCVVDSEDASVLYARRHAQS
ncbi:hypothetical protein EIP91_008964 [Steccherinum ochraceum]|uniref:Uncharacterized protein n=1 Tax=Steccherinum ochraceum TaxID=92696 RepID=A0A4R0RN37_9APHY|nr:hypothetical protein EIP91_008964 [Steccherinum ochraceum]